MVDKFSVFFFFLGWAFQQLELFHSQPCQKQVENNRLPPGLFFGKGDRVEGLQGEQHSGGRGTSSCPISPNLLFRRGGRRVEQHHWISTKKSTHCFLRLCVQRRLYSQIMPQINVRLTPNASLHVERILFLPTIQCKGQTRPWGPH